MLIAFLQMQVLTPDLCNNSGRPFAQAVCRLPGTDLRLLRPATRQVLIVNWLRISAAQGRPCMSGTRRWNSSSF